jgi:SAM-dependent methyltransferase
LSRVARDGSPVDVYRALPLRGEDSYVAEVVPPPATVLDLGCGPGRIANTLVARGYVVTAVDDSPEMLAHVRGAETVLGDVGRLRLRRRFDCVLLAGHFVNEADDERRRAFLDTCVTHVTSAGVLVADAYPPTLEWRAAPDDATRLGDVAIRVLHAERFGDVVHATIAYELDGRVFEQSFTARMLDEHSLRAELAAVGLRFARWLDRDRGWFAAVRG